MIDGIFWILDFYNTYIAGTVMPFLLIASGLFMTCYLRFFYIRHPVKVVKRLLIPSERGTEGGTSPFKAVTMALAGTLGVGNIIGVAAAISAGGPGAVFWMWVSAVAAMSLKYAETLLAVVFRRITEENGVVRYFGGAMYYLRDGLRKCGFKNTRFIGSLFAFLCIFNSLTTGNIVQVNAVSASIPIPKILCGVLFAFLVAVVIIGGVKRISDITMRLIPILSAIYIVLSMYIIIINIEKIPDVFSMIFKDAFDFGSAASGILGFFISKNVRLGVTRGILSNEAGCGTAPTAHASANVKLPSTQGCWGIFEVFADTIVLCSMTAFVILISYEELVLKFSLDGIALTIAAYEKYAGNLAGITLSASVFLFAFATVICQSYYGQEAINFLTPSKKAYKIYIVIFLVAIITGAVISSEKMWILADFTVSTMTIINTTCLLIMAKIVKQHTDL